MSVKTSRKGTNFIGNRILHKSYFLEKFKTPVSTQENFSSLVAEEAETYTTNSQKE